MRKRPKIKLPRRPWKTWLPEVAETLDLNVGEALEYVPAINQHLSLEDVYRLRCNHLSRQVIQSLLQCRRRVVKQLYVQSCSAWPERNVTYMIERIGYAISDALELMTDRMEKNYEELLEKGPEGKPDVYGGSYKTELKQKRGGVKKPAKPKKDRITIVSVIVGQLQRDPEQGVTKEQIHKELVVKFPQKSPQAMRNTIGVQLSYHLKHKYGDRLRKHGKDRWSIL